MLSIRNTLPCNMYIERKKTKPMHHNYWAVKNPPAMQETQETQVRSLGQEDPLEKELAIHSSILAWEFPWTEEPGGLQSMSCRRVGHDWARKRKLYLRACYVCVHARAWELPLLSPRARLLKPACPRAQAPQEKPPQWEAHALQLESSLRLPQRKAQAQPWRPSTAKNKYK